LGVTVNRQENKPDLPKWIAWAWPASFTVWNLNLQGTGVMDAGLKELAGLKNLQELDLRDTKVTEAGVAELIKALPGCKIYR
jgi:hypothetical protein